VRLAFITLAILTLALVAASVCQSDNVQFVIAAVVPSEYKMVPEPD
jgi:hypothetical protein